MVILDSDYMTHLQWPDGRDAQTIRSRLNQHDAQEIGTAIVGFEEHMRGWCVRSGRPRACRIKLTSIATRSWRFCNIAVSTSSNLTKSPRRNSNVCENSIAMDLKIAAIALAHHATLWTRNMRDFGQIDGLDAVDITKE